MTVDWYFTKAFLIRLLAAFAGFTLLLQLLDLFDAASKVLGRKGGLGELPTYLVLRLPLLALQAIPLGVLIGALVAFVTFAQRNETLALRAAGQTPFRMVRGPLAAALVVALAHFSLANWIAPGAERRLQNWWAEDGQGPAPPERNWIASGPDIISFARAEQDGRRLIDLTILERTAGGRALRRTNANEARWDDTGWVLRDGRTITVAGPGLGVADWRSKPWPDGPNPTDIQFVLSPTRYQSFAHLVDILGGRTSGRQSLSYYATRLQKLFSAPASALLMILLAAPALHGYRRSSGFGRGAAAGFVLGFLFLIFDGILAAIGESGLMPSMLAAWAPFALFMCLGGAMFLYLEE